MNRNSTDQRDYTINIDNAEIETFLLNAGG